MAVNGRGGGSVLVSGGAAIRDQAFDGDDHGEGLDLGGHAGAGPFGAQVGDFQRRARTWSRPTLNRRSSGILLDELSLNGGTVLKHVGADARLGFDVGGGLGPGRPLLRPDGRSCFRED